MPFYASPHIKHGELDNQGFSYPFIMKSDVGLRGFGVRKIKNDFDLSEYLLLSDFERIIQELCNFPFESGIFYILKYSRARTIVLEIGSQVRMQKNLRSPARIISFIMDFTKVAFRKSSLSVSS